VVIMAEKRWGDLLPGDVLVCPVTGRDERVIGRKRSGDARVYVRTTVGRHLRSATERVEVLASAPAPSVIEGTFEEEWPFSSYE